MAAEITTLVQRMHYIGETTVSQGQGRDPEAYVQIHQPTRACKAEGGPILKHSKKGAARLPPQASPFKNNLRVAVLPGAAREGTTQIPSDDELIRARFLSQCAVVILLMLGHFKKSIC